MKKRKPYTRAFVAAGQKRRDPSRQHGQKGTLTVSRPGNRVTRTTTMQEMGEISGAHLPPGIKERSHFSRSQIRPEQPPPEGYDDTEETIRILLTGWDHGESL